MLLKIKFQDKIQAKPFKGGHNHTPKFERLLKKTQGQWTWATIYASGKNAEILHYYHFSKGLERLNLNQYKEALKGEKVNLYIIFNKEGKQQRGTEKGQTILNSTLEQMDNFINKNVLKIQAYKNNLLIKTIHNERV